jgi:hypothetical protein
MGAEIRFLGPINGPKALKVDTPWVFGNQRGLVPHRALVQRRFAFERGLVSVEVLG